MAVKKFQDKFVNQDHLCVARFPIRSVLQQLRRSATMFPRNTARKFPARWPDRNVFLCPRNIVNMFPDKLVKLWQDNNVIQ